MVIGIDAREVQKFPTGIGRYFSGLVEGLAGSEVTALSFWGAERLQNLGPGQDRIKDSGQARMTKGSKRSVKFILFVNKGNPLIKGEYPENWEIRIVRAKPKSFLQQVLFPVEVWLGPPSPRLRRVNVLLTNPFGFTVLCPVPQALIILDLIYKHFPQEASLKAKLYDAILEKLAARRAKLIFTCSENSKKDIVKFLGISKEKIVVTPLGVPRLFDLPTSEVKSLGTPEVSWGKHLGGVKQTTPRDHSVGVLGKYGVEKPYVLYVGNMREHKNLRKLFKAFAELRIMNHELKGLKLVIVGSDVGKRKKDYYLLFTDYCLPEFVNILRSVPDEDLAVLYRQAEMLVQPSLYEGFGMSVLEAMACGCPVVASKTSSIPEVGGNAPIYVDSRDPKDIARGIMEVLGYNKGEREKVVRKGLERAKAFSWGKMAEKTLKALITNLNE